MDSRSTLRDRRTWPRRSLTRTLATLLVLLASTLLASHAQSSLASDSNPATGDTIGGGASADAVDEPQPPALEVEALVSGLSIPWDLAFAPDGTMLFTERGGTLSARLTDGTVQTVSAELGDLFARGETGLMAIVVDPDFASNRRFYTCQGHTGREVQVIAWTIDAAYTEATRVADPLVGGLPTASGGRHGGCRLRFGPQGYLWISTGDAARGTTPQDLSSLGGKVLRVDASTGAAAPGNPFGTRIYSYGHRNVQGLALRPGTSEMWSVEHGPSRDDEINLLTSGGNYGWNPVPGYNESVPMTDLTEFPDAVEAKWSSGNPTLATSGGIFLEGEQWGSWEGRLAVATLKRSELRLFEFAADGALLSEVVVPELDGTYRRLRTPMLGPDGALYVATSNGSGVDRILRITATSTSDARLASLRINHVDLGEFSPERTDYTGILVDGVARTVIEASAVHSEATVAIVPSDVDGDLENGHQFALDDGTEITVTVTSADGSRKRVYRVLVEVPPCLDGLGDDFGLVTYEGGSIARLEECARRLSVQAVYGWDGNAYVSYILDAPAFVNEAFVALFEGGISHGTQLLARREPALATPDTGPGGS